MSNSHGTMSPSPWVRRFMPLIHPGSRVLDLAAGSGRHTRLLRDSGFGFDIVAADRDTAALAAFVGDPSCTIRALDLEDGAAWALGQDFGGIVVTNYLHRPLFPALVAALAPGGILIYETFASGNERFGKPSNPDFLLRPGELLEAFATTLTIVAFEQGIVERPKPSVKQRVAAAKAASPLPLPPIG
jgi:SAM-dependent methyltransferase